MLLLTDLLAVAFSVWLLGHRRDESPDLLCAQGWIRTNNLLVRFLWVGALGADGGSRTPNALLLTVLSRACIPFHHVGRRAFVQAPVLTAGVEPAMPFGLGSQPSVYAVPPRQRSSKVVRTRGVEPPRSFEHQHLKLA